MRGEDGLIEISIGNEAFPARQSNPMLTDPDGDRVFDKLHLNAEGTEHWRNHAGVLKRADASIEGESLVGKALHKAACFMPALANKGTHTRFCAIRRCG
ncbi:hypothetical protein SDC9_106126 [bioreactor metagenome]|uniref:Uncharacterized protein n=1 Tax=bioreactor metagenome TaxID=1076179 RepID=A0A645B2J7_9ZZZZ